MCRILFAFTHATLSLAKFENTHTSGSWPANRHRQTIHGRLHDQVRISIFYQTNAILSLATAELSMPSPDIAKVRAAVDQARDKILNLAEGLDDSQKN
jgi:hypothetical protein